MLVNVADAYRNQGTLTVMRSECYKSEGARSEKDITRVSGTLSTGSIPVGRTNYDFRFKKELTLNFYQYRQDAFGVGLFDSLRM